MPIELDPQSLKEYATAAVAWVKKNPIPAALSAGLVLILLLFALVVSSLFKDNVTPEKVSLAEDETNLCQRLHKLDALEPSLQKRGLSIEYKNATSKVFEALLGEAPSPDDLAVLSEVQRTCHGQSNHDFAWAVALEARMRRGGWPSKLALPPGAALRERFLKVLEKVPAGSIVLPVDAAVLDAWFVFATEDGSLMQPIIDAWATAQGVANADRVFATYQAAVRLVKTRKIVEQSFDKLGLLKAPIYVTDVNGAEPVAGANPASQPVSNTAALLPLSGPAGTLVFLGVLGGESCALAASADAFPPLVTRSCRGLVPRRLKAGEIYLFGGQTRAATFYTPAVRQDDGSWLFADAAQTSVSRALMSTFVAAGRGVALNGALAALSALETTNDAALSVFEAKNSKAATVIGFAAPMTLKLEKKVRAHEQRPLQLVEDRHHQALRNWPDHLCERCCRAFSAIRKCDACAS